MRFGLSEAEFKLLEDLVLTPIKKKQIKIYVFGSRATGKHHQFSDIDLLLVPTSSQSLTGAELGKIKEDIEESRFPIKVDLVPIQDLAESYKESVMSQMVECNNSPI